GPAPACSSPASARFTSALARFNPNLTRISHRKKMTTAQRLWPRLNRKIFGHSRKSSSSNISAIMDPFLKPRASCFTHRFGNGRVREYHAVDFVDGSFEVHVGCCLANHFGDMGADHDDAE